MPEALWKKAADLAGEEGISPVARGLRIDYYALKKRAKKTITGEAPGKTPPVSFVEVPFPSPIQGIAIEIFSTDGARLVCRWPASVSLDAAALIRAFSCLDDQVTPQMRIRVATAPARLPARHRREWRAMCERESRSVLRRGLCLPQ